MEFARALCGIRPDLRGGGFGKRGEIAKSM